MKKFLENSRESRLSQVTGGMVRYKYIDKYQVSPMCILVDGIFRYKYLDKYQVSPKCILVGGIFRYKYLDKFQVSRRCILVGGIVRENIYRQRWHLQRRSLNTAFARPHLYHRPSLQYLPNTNLHTYIILA